jgi:stage II sporulation SpoE-like protein
VNDRRQWAERYDVFWRSMPRRSHFLFLAGVFVIFLPAGLLTDIPVLGANGIGRLIFTTCLSGTLSVAYVLVVRARRGWLVPLIVVHVLIFLFLDRLVGPLGPPLTGEALRSRLIADVNGSITAIVFGFILLTQLIRREGVRYVRAHAEIALASDIHRQLVPRIERRIGGFEFRGVSFASGAVGGDLLDVVESPSGWTGYVADVSGHGVAAGLMMGMAKSTVRTQLRDPRTLESLLETSNAVLFELKAPTMFVTFAGVQASSVGLRFIVAGHLPILRYSASANAVEEWTIPHVPLAMFPETAYASADLPCDPGDLLVILTDGLIEVFDAADREFDLERVKSLIHDHAQAPLQTLEARLFDAVRSHGAQLDDQTLLLIRALPTRDAGSAS